MDFESEFLNTYSEIRGYLLPRNGLAELSVFYPELYSEGDFNKPEKIVQGSKGYFKLIKMYLTYYRIPYTLESVTAAYDWGIKNLVEKGLLSVPPETKQLIGKIRVALQPQAEMMEAQYNKE